MRVLLYYWVNKMMMMMMMIERERERECEEAAGVGSARTASHGLLLCGVNGRRRLRGGGEMLTYDA